MNRNKPYYPYKSTDRLDKKFYIITQSGKKVYFGAAGYEDYTIHKDPVRKERYINRHHKNETWTRRGIDTPGFWSRWLLWNKPSLRASYTDLRERFLM